MWWESIEWVQSCSTKIDRTDMTKLMVAFRNFAKTIKKFTVGDRFISERAKIVHK